MRLMLEFLLVDDTTKRAYFCHEEQNENRGSQYEDEPSEEPVGSTGEVGEKQCCNRVHHTDHGNEENGYHYQFGVSELLDPAQC